MESRSKEQDSAKAMSCLTRTWKIILICSPVMHKQKNVKMFHSKGGIGMSEMLTKLLAGHEPI